MAETRVSTGALSEVIELYLKLLREASKIQVELEDPPGGRIDLDPGKLNAIVTGLSAASGALAQGCQQGVYGLFLIKE